MKSQAKEAYVKRLVIVAIAVSVTLLLSGCGTGSASKPSAQDLAQRVSNQLQGQVYQSKHNIEFRNYNLRQRIADDPATILWCTFFPPTVGQEPVTVPVAGKLTSSNKRPYNDVRYRDAGNYAWYPFPVPGPDHMFGASSEYRFGFDPTLAIYYDFTDLASFCTNEPTVWQANKTTIVVKRDATLGALTRAAEAALRQGDAKKSLALLTKAESK